MCIRHCKIFPRIQTNLGSSLCVSEFQPLIGKFSSCWLSTSPHLEGTVPSLFSLQAPEGRSRGAGQPCLFRQEKAGQGAASRDEQVTEPNGSLQGKRCPAVSLNPTGRVLPLNRGLQGGAGAFFWAGCCVLGHLTPTYFATTQLPSKATLFILALTPALHESSHVLWEQVWMIPLLLTTQGRLCSNLPPAPGVGLWSALLGRHPRQLSTS